MRIIEDKIQITKNTLVTTLDQVTKEYKLSLEVNITKIDKVNFRNILHFTVGLDSGDYGTRTPKVSLAPEGRLKIYAAVNGITEKGYAFTDDDVFNLGQWVSIEISQVKGPLGYNFTISMEGKQLHTIINNQPETFYKVRCYVSNPKQRAQLGSIRNVFFYYKLN